MQASMGMFPSFASLDENQCQLTQGLPHSHMRHKQLYPKALGDSFSQVKVSKSIQALCHCILTTKYRADIRGRGCI